MHKYYIWAVQGNGRCKVLFIKGLAAVLTGNTQVQTQETVFASIRNHQYNLCMSL